MFKSEQDTRFARRIARMAFGAVLIAGMCVVSQRTSLSFRNIGERELHAAAIFGLTWAGAIGAAMLAYAIAMGRGRADGGDRLLAWSLGLPAVGIALMLPLTLHMPFVFMLGGVAGFDMWCEASLTIVGLAHVALAVMMAWRAVRAARGQLGMSPANVYLITIVVSCIPFVVLYGIPPILVALTGMPFPAIMRWGDRMAARERLAPSVPRAIAVIHAAH